jgi:hypothetical protein
MKKNIIITLVSHITIGIFCYVSEIAVYGTFMSDSGTLYEPRYTVIFCILAITQLVIVTALYFFTGYLFIKPAKSRIRTAISVWYLFVIIIFMFMTASFVERIDYTFSFMYFICSNPISYGIIMGLGYLNYNIAAFNNSFAYDVLYWFFTVLSLLIPSGALWLGMFSRKKNRNKLKEAKSKRKLLQVAAEDGGPDETTPVE